MCCEEKHNTLRNVGAVARSVQTICRAEPITGDRIEVGCTADILLGRHLSRAVPRVLGVTEFSPHRKSYEFLLCQCVVEKDARAIEKENEKTQCFCYRLSFQSSV